MKMKGRYWRPECAVTSVNMKFPSRLSKFLPLLPLSLCLETLCLVLYCFVLVLYHTAFMLNNETCKPDVSIYARQASLV